MSKRSGLAMLALLLLWAVVILPLWLIGLGYDANGFRVPVFGRDKWADLMIFYAPLLISAYLVIKPLRKILGR
ncbi:MAG: hypothetical protein WBL20_15480 [Sphingobium sp.]|uniref:hypothetical protein n=1 Tax=Sphingobium sp. TaxID=1912891 RepID=UPI002E1EC9B3